MGFREKKIITAFMSETYGITLSYIAKKNKISLFKIYNFVKGIQRNIEIEQLFINEYAVPKKLIDKTFKLVEEKNAINK